MALDGNDLDIDAEHGTMTVHRTNAAKMVLKTISKDHEPWIRDTDQSNPQALFRRMHLKFRGSENIALAAQVEAQLITMSMASAKMTVAAYGSAMVELMRKLKDMNSPTDELRVVNLYLLGLASKFDHIRFKLQDQILQEDPQAPRTMAAVRKVVEDWSVKMGRGLVSFVDKTGNDSNTPLLTLLGMVEPASAADPDACRNWVKTGKCKFHDLGTCEFKHAIRTKGVNAPNVKDAHDAAKGKGRDFSDYKCESCQTIGHSKNWGGCPTKLKKKAAAAVLQTTTLNLPPPPPPAAAPAPAAAPSLLEVQMTALTKTMHEVLHVMAKGDRRRLNNPLLLGDGNHSD